MEKTAADQTAVFEEKGFYLHAFDEFAEKMKRGAGTVPGVITGALLVGVINIGMSIMGVDQNYQKVVKGPVLLAAVIFDVVSKKKNR